MQQRLRGLRWAVSGALIAGLVLAATGAAADGQTLVIGQTNTATNATTLSCSRPGLIPSSCFVATSNNGTGLDGRSTGGGGTGVFGSSTAGTGVWGQTTVTGGPAGVRGEALATSGLSMGVLGRNSSATDLSAGVKGETNGGGGAVAGVYGSSPSGFGLLGSGNIGLVSVGTSLAGYFGGNVFVAGTLSKSAGSFRIDHPLDPQHKYLQHSFVESPDMMNVYNGNVRTDGRGFATVRLPRYFSVLNRDFRYQLTIVGTRGWQARVLRKIAGNRFTVQTDVPRALVSWQVTGIRKDAYANAHRIRPEISKAAVAGTDFPSRLVRAQRSGHR
jgi:hypothetical protein